MEPPCYTIADLLRVMERLRDPQHGCPWDLRQDFNSIVPSTLEECYELAQAIEHEDYPHVAEELGDVLFQVIFYSQMAAEQGLFTFDVIVNTLVEKLIRRHPHVFAEGQVEGVVTERTSVDEVKLSWESIKKGERSEKNQHGALADVPTALPALARAQKLQKRASQLGFDWQEVSGVLEKLQEEMDELRQAIAKEGEQRIDEELGDVLFTCVNLARHLGRDAESSLRHSSARFEQRFSKMEELSLTDGRELEALNAEQFEELWLRVKRD